jgi:hypothetical protein
MVAEPVIGTRGDGAIDLDKDRLRDAASCQYPLGVSCQVDLVFLHGVKQHTFEVLIVSADVFYKVC